MTLWEKIFGRKEKKNKEAEKPQEMPTKMPVLKGESLAIYNVLLGGLERVKREGMTRVYLFSEDIEPDKDATGRWINMGDTIYYPYEMLDPREQEKVLAKKSYAVGCLVSDNIPINEEHGLKKVNYPGYGFEVCHRTHFHPMLCKLKDDGETINRMKYCKTNCWYSPEQMKLIADSMGKAGVTAQQVNDMVGEGIRNYHQITHSLMEKAGVSEALQKMDERERTPSEEIFYHIQQKIKLAKLEKERGK